MRRNGNGNKINYTVVKSSEKYREIILDLPRALGPLDRIKYRITYQVNGTPEQNNLYYLSPRTITKNLSLTIKGYEGYEFSNARVAVETEGGFHKDNPPEMSVKKENGIEMMSAKKEVSNVPIKKGKAPYTLLTGSQVLFHKYFMPNDFKEGID